MRTDRPSIPRLDDISRQITRLSAQKVALEQRIAVFEDQEAAGALRVDSPLSGLGTLASPLRVTISDQSPNPAQTSQNERRAWYSSASNSTRLWSPLDVVDAIEYRTGFRVVRTVAELDLAIADASIKTIRIVGLIDISTSKVLAHPVTIEGGRNGLDGVRVTENVYAFDIRSSNVTLSGLKITSTFNDKGGAVTIARNGAHKAIVIDSNLIESIGKGIYTGASGQGSATIEVTITNNRITDLREDTNTENYDGFGIYLDWNWHLTITDNVIEGTQGNSIELLHGANDSSAIVSNNVLRESNRFGLELFVVDVATVTGNLIEDHHSIGMSLAITKRCTCSGNVVRTVGDIGIECFNIDPPGAALLTVTGNTVEGLRYGRFSAGTALMAFSVEHFTGSSLLSITGNTINCAKAQGSNTVPFAIQLMTSENVTISGNNFVLNDSHGVVFNTGSDKCVMQDNRFKILVGGSAALLYVGTHVVRNNISNNLANNSEFYCGGATVYFDDTGTPFVGPGEIFGSNLRI